MKKKYLLSTGLLTDQVEYYIIDLFKLHLSVYPKDIPGADWIGFDFIMTDTKKDEIRRVATDRLNKLVSKIQKNFNDVSIRLSEPALIDETTLKVILDVNQIQSEEILIDLYNN